jgi:hypothetical protein
MYGYTPMTVEYGPVAYHGPYCTPQSYRGYGQVHVGEYNGWVSAAKEVLQYLGYDIPDLQDVIDEPFTFAVATFQRTYAELYGLEETGWLDPKTTEALQLVYAAGGEMAPVLMPIYMTEAGLLIGWPGEPQEVMPPPTTKDGPGWGTVVGALGVLAGVVVAVGLAIGFKD